MSNELMFKAVSKGISPEEYQALKKILQDSTGINLGEQKQALLESRINWRLNELKLTNFSDYIVLVKKSPDEFKLFVNCMTTNKTDWFREIDHFRFLMNHIVLEISPSVQRPLYIWSAACSTGEEVYSLAFNLDEALGSNLAYRILGTDLDTEVLEVASSGRYSSRQVLEQVPPHYASKYFFHNKNSKKEQLEVVSEIKKSTKFREYNLISSSLSSDVQFDVIFLRNVLIYFNESTIQKVIDGLMRYLSPNGYFFIGHSESLNGINHPLERVGTSIFKKPG